MGVIDVYSILGFREPVSCLTHLLAVPAFAVMGYILVRRGRGNRLRMASLAVMVVSTLFLLSMSSVYHLLAEGTARYVMRQLDLAGIFALIAGTATPVHIILFTGWKRWAPLVLIWLAAATGITLRTAFPGSLPPGGGTGIFLLMGWSGIVTFAAMWRRYGYSFVEPLLWGGVAYSAGAIALGFGWPILLPQIIGAHEVWHVAVLIGLGLHWRFVFQFADGRYECERVHHPDSDGKMLHNEVVAMSGADASLP